MEIQVAPFQAGATGHIQGDPVPLTVDTSLLLFATPYPAQWVAPQVSSEYMLDK